MTDSFPLFVTIMVLDAGAVFLLARFGLPVASRFVRRQESWLDQVLNHELLLDIHPRVALLVFTLAAMTLGALTYFIGDSTPWFFLGAGIGLVLPTLTLRHLQIKRRKRLESQLVDAIMTLASAVRAGLTLVQAMELLVANQTGPVKQEFAQLLREYQMGLDLNQAMRNASNRIGLSNYRLLFTAIEMHRLRGGNTGESLDRIAESVREIQRLEGKLDALTSHGRSQARMLASMPIVILIMYYAIEPDQVGQLFSEPIGRLFLLGAALCMMVAFLWIRSILRVDI